MKHSKVAFPDAVGKKVKSVYEPKWRPYGRSLSRFDNRSFQNYPHPDESHVLYELYTPGFKPLTKRNIC